MQVWLVQVILGERFEDLYVTAKSASAAIAKARKQTTLPARWARFAI